MKSLVGFLLVFALVVMSVSVAVARGAPQQKAFAVEQVMTVEVAPTVASVPPMTVGFDVIQNISESKTLLNSRIMERWRQSTTVDRYISKAAPAYVLLA
jgi:low affinity Fe/Cu permease